MTDNVVELTKEESEYPLIGPQDFTEGDEWYIDEAMMQAEAKIRFFEKQILTVDKFWPAGAAENAEKQYREWIDEWRAYVAARLLRATPGEIKTAVERLGDKQKDLDHVTAELKRRC